MTLPRKSLISLSDTPFYHCMSRCVRRAYLCGHDRYTQKSYEHRRGWLELKLLTLADTFAIKLCAYAVMSNHYHVVLHVRQDIANEWSDLDVIQRWHRLFNGTLLSTMHLNGEALSQTQWRRLRADVKKWRARLCSISWFMRIVNESIARQANKEDKCSGRFWEGRFKSQALLDERALISCMAYVDLNPIRAGLASTPEQSHHTSIRARIYQTTNSSLEQFVGVKQEEIGIPFRLKEYIKLVDYTGRIIRADKRGFMLDKQPEILKRLSLDDESWSILATRFEDCFQTWVSSKHIARILSIEHCPTSGMHA